MQEIHNQQLASGPDDEIDLSELFAVLMRHRWLVALVFVLVFIIGSAYAILATPMYQADALIQVENRSSAAMSGLSAISESLGGGATSPLSGEVEILRSREVLMAAIKNNQANISVQVADYLPLIGAWLARRFQAQNPGELAAPLWGLKGYAWGGENLRFALLDLPTDQYGQTFYLQAGSKPGEFEIYDAADKQLASGAVGERVSFTIEGEPARLAVQDLSAQPGIRFSFSARSPLRTYKSLAGALTIEEAGKASNMISLKYENASDAFAVSMVNAIAQSYLEQNVARRTAEARSSLEFLQTQLPNLKREMDRAEDALSTYRTDSKTIALDKETGLLLDRAVQMENRRLELRLKRDELLQRFTAQHPDVKNLEKQLVALEEVSAQLQHEIDRLPSAQRELLPYERDARVNTSLYVSLLNNAQELRVAEAGTIGNVRIIDYAVPTEQPIKPKKLLIVGVAAALGLILGILAAFIAYFLRPAAQRPEVLEQATGLSNYASLPESDTQLKLGNYPRYGKRNGAAFSHQLLALKAPQDPAIETLRSLRTGLSFALMGDVGKVVAISGATSAVGKSFISANFATLLAAAGKKVVLVDCDMRRPRLDFYFSYQRKSPGLSGILAGEFDYQQVLHHEAEANIDVIPAGIVPPNPGELLLTARLGQLLTQLQEDYDLVLLDTPPILPVADTLAIFQHVNAGFLVARAELTTAGELNDALAKLRHSGLAERVKGMIFNGIKLSRMGYGGAYKYYYQYK